MFSVMLIVNIMPGWAFEFRWKLEFILLLLVCLGGVGFVPYVYLIRCA